MRRPETEADSAACVQVPKVSLLMRRIVHGGPSPAMGRPHRCAGAGSARPDTQKRPGRCRPGRSSSAYPMAGCRHPGAWVQHGARMGNDARGRGSALQAMGQRGSRTGMNARERESALKTMAYSGAAFTSERNPPQATLIGPDPGSRSGGPGCAAAAPGPARDARPVRCGPWRRYRPGRAGPAAPAPRSRRRSA
jgi:hypothetical protein